jgi:NTE family protein
VLDELLNLVAEGQLKITAISGASGGALTGAVCAYGLIKGPEEAKRLLEKFWMSVSDQSLWPEFPLSKLLPRDSPSRWNVDWNPLAIGFEMTTQITSPYWSPWGYHDIIKPLLNAVIEDYSAFGVRSDQVPPFYVSATAVDRTALRIFGPKEITVDALLASACLPTFFRAVEIDGVPYWDGGYLANPALRPLLPHAKDLLTILIDPLNIKNGAPITPRQIVNRINEVSFNSSWVQEVKQIELMNKLIREGYLVGSKYEEKWLHLINNDDFMSEIGAASKIVPSRDFILELRDKGRETAKEWINENWDRLGKASTFDLEAEVALRLHGGANSVRELKR